MARRKPTFVPHPAPGKLRWVQDFLNTRKLETDSDELWGPEALATWLTRRELLAADVSLDDQAWRSALAVREGLRALIQALGAAPPRGVVEELNAALGELRPRLRFDGKGFAYLETVDQGWPGALERLILPVFDAMRQRRWRRMKACHSESCQLVFYDSSRNRAGKWCTVDRCGNRANRATYRRRGPVWKRGRHSRS